MRHQTLGFCQAADGTRIAMAAIGSGPLLLRVARLSPVEQDVESPVRRHWLEELSRDHRYNARGALTPSRRKRTHGALRRAFVSG